MRQQRPLTITLLGFLGSLGPLASSPTASLISVGVISVGVVGSTSHPAYSQETRCPAALERSTNHTVSSGETLENISAQYRLQPTVLASFNPGVGNTPAAGTTLIVPPFNGLLVSASAGDSWQSLAERYGSRADILFEINGCLSALPSRVFIPSANPIAAAPTRTAVVQLPGYPLAQPADIVRSYGWQPSETRDELVFNNGIAFAANGPTEVLSVENGTVAFAGAQEGYGLLVVVNHAQGIQTRYANLSDISVAVGQSVTTDTPVGSIEPSPSGPNQGASANTPSYLYFEVRTNSASGWVAENPGRYLPTLQLR
ncbi:MAG: M23 family metallopeptidase [Cyanobacteria bacterium P01_F01_bin.53]